MDRAERLAEIRKRWKAPRNPIREYEYSEVMEACDDIKKARALILSVLENGTEVMRIANNAIEDIPFLLGEVGHLEELTKHLGACADCYNEHHERIERLEAENAALRRERDAAVSDISEMLRYPNCKFCKAVNEDGCPDCSLAQWRGVESKG